MHSRLLLLLFSLFPLAQFDDNCNFNVHTITSSTSFPSSCSTIIGRFLINEKSQLSDAQLTTLFKDVTEIQGVLQIWNTDLTSISFTKTLKTISGDPLDKMLSILNNTQLKSIALSSLSAADGRVQIQKNPVLNLRSSCETLHSVFFNRRFISGNQQNCGCELRQPFREARDFPEGCIVLYGNIQIDGSPPSYAQLYRLSSVQTLYGSIRITGSNIESLGFLQNLREIEIGLESEYIIELSMNLFLGRLDLISLNSMKSRNPFAKLSIRSNRELCVDPGFVQLVARSNVYSMEINDASFCDKEFINNPSTYCFGNLSTVNDRCTRYIGNMMYFNKPFFYMSNFTFTRVPLKDLRKMQQFEVIFGTIYIEGSSLTNFTLPNLQEIYQVDDASQNTVQMYYNYAISLRYNYLLKEVSFPNLKIAFKMVYFESNTNLTTDDDFCRRVSNGTRRMILGTTGEYDCRPYLTELTTLPMSTALQTSTVSMDQELQGQ